MPDPTRHEGSRPDESRPDESRPAESDPSVPDSAGAPAGKQAGNEQHGRRPALHWPRLLSSSRASVVLVALLCMLLGIGIVTQVRDTSSGDALESARPADLLAVLDNLHRREASLRQEIAGLEQSVQSMEADGDDSQAALAQARERLSTLKVLVGVVPAQGPGAVVTVNDPAGAVDASVLLDLLQELRAAGAEAIEFTGAGAEQAVRIGSGSSITGAAGRISVDGTRLDAPFTVTAIGDGPTMTAALNIPGGVQDTVRRASGNVSVEPRDHVEITAVRQPEAPRYARPDD